MDMTVAHVHNRGGLLHLFISYQPSARRPSQAGRGEGRRIGRCCAWCCGYGGGCHGGRRADAEGSGLLLRTHEQRKYTLALYLGTVS